MDHAEEYFDILQNVKGVPLKRKVFIASDDPSVITEATNKLDFLKFVFLYNSLIFKSYAKFFSGIPIQTGKF